MTIVAERNDSVLTLHVAGRFDTNTAPKLEEAISAIPPEVTALILDMKKIEYVSSAGLRVLLGTQKKMSRVGGTLRLTGVCDAVMEVLEMTGFADILEIE